MNASRWIQSIYWLSLVATVLVVAWWAVVFYFFGQQTGDPMTDYIPCLFAPTQACNLVRGMAWMRGMNVFEPLALWWTLSLLMTSALARKALQEKAYAPV